MDNKKFFEKYIELKNSKHSFVIVTMTSIRGSAPQNLGAKMLVDKSGLLFGTVGGGKVEAYCIDYAKKILNSSEKVFSEKWNLQTDIGMTCGGEVQFLFENESNQSSWNIAIFGAGHVSQALVKILLTLDCHITVIDNRKEWLLKLPEDSNLNKVYHSEMCKEVGHLLDNTFVLSMTMGHAYDVPILDKCLKRDFPLVGVIGSITKRNAIEQDLKKIGHSHTVLEKLICPIGEPIGNNDPAEIAISIVAQLLKVRDNLY